MIDKGIISVIGSGTMGNGIAHVFSICPNIERTILVDLNDSILNQAQLVIKKNLDRQIKKEIISKNDAKTAYDKILFTSNIKDISLSDLVIEAVKEDLNVKKTVFSNIDKLTSSNCILATNTSSISISAIAKSTKKPQNVIGMHFMNPVPIMKLVEVIKTERTSAKTLEKIIETTNSLNKYPVECLDSPGFISNRILMPMINEAVYTLMEGVATKEAIDEIMKLGMAHPMGPLSLADLIGLDVCLSILNVLKEGFNDNPKYEPCPLLIEMCEKGKLGRKTGEGFYKY